jgi:hypothetical protein
MMALVPCVVSSGRQHRHPVADVFREVGKVPGDKNRPGDLGQREKDQIVLIGSVERQGSRFGFVERHLEQPRKPEWRAALWTELRAVQNLSVFQQDRGADVNGCLSEQYELHDSSNVALGFQRSGDEDVGVQDKGTAHAECFR